MARRIIELAVLGSLAVDDARPDKNYKVVMGASVFAFWPGITAKQLKSQPGFSNDCKAWGDFMGDLVDNAKALKEIEKAGAGAVITFKTQGLEDDDVDWVTPAEVEAAAILLRDLVRKKDRSVRRVLEVYATNANEIDPIHEEMARDLDDIAEIARWAKKAKTKRMTFDINW